MLTDWLLNFWLEGAISISGIKQRPGSCVGRAPHAGVIAGRYDVTLNLNEYNWDTFDFSLNLSIYKQCTCAMFNRTDGDQNFIISKFCSGWARCVHTGSFIKQH